ncbi:MAG: endolytic transglycosylase MltG [Pseudomonadota bacterium]|uniref:endolytic transglycosylase MltG n=1 Tax=Fodinicurvata fenggangensis TaxID=1121830 RepID=UPI00047CF0A8|nr:endolytic transglycosylase MltG [Fodinicurvata fenggangensis]
MRGALRFFLVLIVTGALLLAVAGLLAYQAYEGEGPVKEETVVLIDRGSGVRSIAAELKEQQVIDDALVFQVAARLTGKAGRLQAGEYEFPPGTSLREVLDKLESGDFVVRQVTIPEGRTSYEVVALLEGIEVLEGDIPELPPEGSLLPETYHYQWGDTRQALIERMQQDMQALVQELWPERIDGLPLETPEEAITLASIVEKETAVASERPMVASVFINRLRRDMPLQSDPTVIYSLTDGKGPLDRELTRKDWEVEDPYNTYYVNGLPPGPIANPGRESLEAVLDPAETDYIYFVADGTGGHAFAQSLDEHNRNVRNWRRIRDGEDE